MSALQPLESSDTLPVAMLHELYRRWKQQYSNPHTRRTYQQALADYARWMGVPPKRAVRLLLTGGAARGTLQVGDWVSERYEDGLSASSIHTRLAAIRAIVKLGRQLGLISWHLEVRAPRVRAYKSQRVVSHEEYRQMISVCRLWHDQAGSYEERMLARRDEAMLWCLGELALRLMSALSLRVQDLDLAERVAWVELKRRDGRHRHVVTDAAARGIAAYLQVRGDHHGPLFGYFEDGDWQALCARQMRRRVHRVARAAGIECSPHDLRHYGITRVYELTGSHVLAKEWAQHESIQTTIGYLNSLDKEQYKAADALNDAEGDEE